MSRRTRIWIGAGLSALALMWVTYLHASRTHAFWGDVVALTVMAGIVGGLGGAFVAWMRAPRRR